MKSSITIMVFVKIIKSFFDKITTIHWVLKGTGILGIGNFQLQNPIRLQYSPDFVHYKLEIISVANLAEDIIGNHFISIFQFFRQSFGNVADNINSFERKNIYVDCSFNSFLSRSEINDFIVRHIVLTSLSNKYG